MKNNTPLRKWAHPCNWFEITIFCARAKFQNVTTTDLDVNSIHRDLFSDLTESPILTFFIHMVPPFKQGYDPNFHSKLIGKRFSF